MVGGMEALWDEQLHRLPEQLLARVSEHRLGPGIGKDDAAVASDPDDRVWRELEELLVTPNPGGRRHFRYRARRLPPSLAP